jgi:hypothetical protein
MHRRPIAARTGATLLLAAALVLPSATDAQSPRLQGAWVNDQAAGVLFGLEARGPIGGPETYVDSNGITRQRTRNYLWTVEGAAGLNLNRPGPGNVDPLFYVHGGVLYRTGNDMFSRVGGVVAAYVPDAMVGPAARLEVAGVIDVQAGYLFGNGGGAVHLALDISYRFFRDLFGGG